MSETKKRLYTRKTAYRHLDGLIARAIRLNCKTTGLPYPDSVKKLIVFGSYVKSKKTMVHDVDVYIELTMDIEGQRRFRDTCLDRSRYHTITDWEFATYSEELKYLKNRSRVISLHGEYDKEIALANTHLCVFENGILQTDSINKLKKLQILCTGCEM